MVRELLNRSTPPKLCHSPSEMAGRSTPLFPQRWYAMVSYRVSAGRRGIVGRLRVAWVYRTGDYLRDRSRFEAAPLVVDGTLYVSTPLGHVIAIDPERGIERWRYDARVSLEGDYGDFANRGVATWLDQT